VLLWEDLESFECLVDSSFGEWLTSAACADAIKLVFRSFYTGMSIRKLLDEGVLGPERSVQGLPEDAKINLVSW
jgi:hypothetical protein